MARQSGHARRSKSSSFHRGIHPQLLHLNLLLRCMPNTLQINIRPALSPEVSATISI
jgi:hypothetical protein